MIANNENDLGQALEREEDTITVTGKLAGRIKRLHALNMALWCLCAICLAVSVAALLSAPATAGASAAVGLVAGTPAAAALGVPAAVTAALTAAAGGGMQALKNLREDYWIEEIGPECIVLHRKGTHIRGNI